MERVKSGLTILLNTKSNCTFLANDFDEEVQTGSRESDKHIEITGELNINPFNHMIEVLRLLYEETNKLKDHVIEQKYIDWEDESIDGCKELDNALNQARNVLIKRA